MIKPTLTILAVATALLLSFLVESASASSDEPRRTVAVICDLGRFLLLDAP